MNDDDRGSQRCLPPPLMSVDLYPLASLEQVENTPSRLDGIPSELEEDLRAYGCKLIAEAGVLLNQYVASAVSKTFPGSNNSEENKSQSPQPRYSSNGSGLLRP
jgi:hypothetical protein